MGEEGSFLEGGTHGISLSIKVSYLINILTKFYKMRKFVPFTLDMKLI